MEYSRLNTGSALIVADPLKAWIAERAGEAGLDYLAAKKRLAARQEEE